MSTKVYKGFRFVSNDLLAIHEKFMAWRLRIRELTIEYEGRYIARQTVKLIDSFAAGRTTSLPDNPFSKVRREFEDAQSEIKKTQRRNPTIDWDFEVMVMPFRDQVYGIVFTDQNDWFTDFMAQDWVEDYSYWNNTDPPDGTSDEEWEIRGELWDSICNQDPSGVPGRAGFLADCTVPFRWTTVDDVMPYLPTFEDRLKSAAKAGVFMVKARELAPPAGDPSPSFGWLWEVEKYVNSDDGQAAIEAEVNRLRPILKEELTKVDLLGWDPDAPK